MKIEFLGFIPVLLFFSWANYMTFIHRKEDFDPTFYRILFVILWMLLATLGVIWGLSGLPLPHAK